jgi:hypothetical protein
MSFSFTISKFRGGDGMVDHKGKAARDSKTEWSVMVEVKTNKQKQHESTVHVGYKVSTL